MRAPTFTRWQPFEERYWGRVRKTDNCWTWTGRLDHKGYGQRIGRDGRLVRPHRLAYEMVHGHIPAGLVIDHLCRNRACVNPDHLEAVSALENTARGKRARWTEPCPNGHPAGLYRHTLPSGKNVCVACRRLSDRTRDERNRERRRAAARARYAARREVAP